jgi:hypothetical protein
MRCLVCEGQRLVPLFEGVRDHYGIAAGDYRFVRCAECGSATLDPLPSFDAVAALYPGDYTFKADEGGAPRAGGARAAGAAMVRRAGGALLLLPAVALAWAERRGGGRTGTMLFVGRKPEAPRAR